MGKTKNYEKLTIIFFGLVCFIRIIDIVLLYMGIATAFELGYGETTYAWYTASMPMIKSPLLWVEFGIFLLIFIGTIIKKKSLITIASVIGIIICLLNITGVLHAVLITASGYPYPFSTALFNWWAGAFSKNARRFTEINIILLTLYYISLIVLSKSKKSTTSFGVVSLILALVITLLRLADRRIWAWGLFPFSSRQILPIALLIILGISLGLAPFFYSKQWEKVTVTTSQKNNGSGSSSDVIIGLTRIKDLLDRGVLTQEEFEEQKKKLLGL